MEDGTYLIGRAPDGRAGRGRRRLTLADPTVSQEHAELVVLDGTYYLIDLDSRNGTWRYDGSERAAHREGYVDLHEPLGFGAVQCSLADLLRT